jgi:CelD/BcsL family acetyltransferase involved in cellulose biosynthesis
VAVEALSSPAPTAVTENGWLHGPAAPVGPEWDAFVSRYGGQLVHAYQLGPWSEILRRAYGAELLHLVARDSRGQLTAGMPLVAEAGLLRSGRLSSMMMAVRGGPIGVDAAARADVLKAAIRLVDERGLKGLLITTEVPGCEQLVPVRVTRYAPTWVTPLPEDGDELRRVWRKKSKNLARNLSKAERAGAIVRPARSRADLWRFYRQYARTMRAHRVTPVSWLEIRLAHKLLAPSSSCRVWVAEYQGQVVAGAMFLAAGTTMSLLYAGSDPRALDVRPNHAIYWHAVEWAIASGMTVIDWGTAPINSSLAKFKRQWSADPIDVFRYMYPPAAPTDQTSESRSAAVTQRPGPRSAPPGGAGYTIPGAGLTGRVWDRIPPDVLGLAATVAHRLL